MGSLTDMERNGIPVLLRLTVVDDGVVDVIVVDVVVDLFRHIMIGVWFDVSMFNGRILNVPFCNLDAVAMYFIARVALLISHGFSKQG